MRVPNGQWQNDGLWKVGTRKQNRFKKKKNKTLIGRYHVKFFGKA
jgi:hypothetical protein